MSVAPQPANALEQRIYNLLRPFRNECFAEADPETDTNAVSQAVKLERKVIALSQNLAFLAHVCEYNTERSIGVEDVFVIVRGWDGDGVAKSTGVIAVLVRYPEATKGVVKASFEKGADVIEALCAKVDEVLAEVI